ncbi:MAG: GNAT family N-acetyltransferase [Candidatus Babeliales bacterium]|nr:GNAT family N-acetyltransferase [Candidatus Babeliales bacterium]
MSKTIINFEIVESIIGNTYYNELKLNGTVLGYLSYIQQANNSFFINQLYIYPLFRGNKLASLLLQSVCSELSIGATKISVCPLPFEKDANDKDKIIWFEGDEELQKIVKLKNFYKKHGFVENQKNMELLIKKEAL